MPSAPPPPRAAARGPRRVATAAAVAALVLSSALIAPGGAQAQEPSPLPQPRTEEELAEAARRLEETLALAPESPPSPDDPFAELVVATDLVDGFALARLDATGRSQTASAVAEIAAGELEAAAAEEQSATTARNEARDEAVAERERLKNLVVKAFVSGGTSKLEEYRAYVEGDTSDPQAGQRIMFDQVLARQERVTDRAERDLADARSALRVARQALAEAEATSAAAEERRSQASRVLTEATASHLRAVAARDAVLADLRSGARAGGGPVPLEVPLIGMPRLTADDLASWFRSGAWQSRIPTPIEDLARWFIEEGRTEGIRGDIAFAQAVLETGGFANTDSVIANNYSGIGHYDNAPLGFIFPSPEAGVRAQIQLLKGYAIAKPEYVNPLVDRRLRGPAGCCTTWGELTTVWATDPTYGPKVMLLYSSLVEHAFERRARGDDLVVAAP